MCALSCHVELDPCGQAAPSDDSADLRSGLVDCSPNYSSCHLAEDRSSRSPWAHLPSSGPLALADRAHIFIKPFTPVPLFHRSNIPRLPEHPSCLIATFPKPWKTDDRVRPRRDPVFTLSDVDTCGTRGHERLHNSSMSK